MKNQILIFFYVLLLQLQLIGIFRSRSRSRSLCLEKSRTNNSSFVGLGSIKTPADYPSLTQAPIRGGLIFVGFAASCAIMFASGLAYLAVKCGLYLAPFFETAFVIGMSIVSTLIRLTQELIRYIFDFKSRPGSGNPGEMLMGMNGSNAPLDMDTTKSYEPITLDSKENGTPTTPENLSLKNKPTQAGYDSIWLLLLAYFTKSSEYGQILLPFDPIVLTKADPFFFNMCLLYVNVCEFGILFAVFLLFISPIAISIYTYNKLPNLKSYFSKKENILWARLWLNVIPFIITSKLIFNPYGYRFFLLIRSFIVFINTGSFSYYYYNPPGLAMGSSRVLHPADYTHIATYFNLQYINPDYILHVVIFIKYCAIFVIAYICYFIIATVTTEVYNKDKFALSLPGGPASLNLFTKCFYFKSQQARINNLLLFSAIMLILLVLTSFVLYHYISIYHLG